MRRASVVALAVLLAVNVAQDGEDVRSVENNTDYGNKSSAAPQYTIKQLKRERSICKLLQMRHYVKCMVDDSIHNRNCAVFFAKREFKRVVSTSTLSRLGVLPFHVGQRLVQLVAAWPHLDFFLVVC